VAGLNLLPQRESASSAIPFSEFGRRLFVHELGAAQEVRVQRCLAVSQERFLQK
jgi:hypothetical protein